MPPSVTVAEPDVEGATPAVGDARRECGCGTGVPPVVLPARRRYHPGMESPARRRYHPGMESPARRRYHPGMESQAGRLCHTGTGSQAGQLYHTGDGGGAVTICHPVWQLGCGGLERQLLQMIEHLPKAMFRHVLVVRGWDGDSMNPERLDTGETPMLPGETTGGTPVPPSHGITGETPVPHETPAPHVEIVRQPSRGRDRLWPMRLAAVLRDHSVDVLHVRGLAMLVDGVLAAKMHSATAVAFSFHGMEASGGEIGWLRRRAYRAAVARCDDCWAVSRGAAETVARKLRIAADRFAVLPNGVDARRYVPATSRDDVRRRLNLPLDRTVVLAVGNMKPIKGHDVLLNAVRQMRGDADRMTVVIVGGDYQDGAMQRWASENVPDADIRFVGRQLDTLPWYQAADVFVLPSRWEGMSNALLEAMSCGLPAVATAVGGNPEVIENGETGLLVSPGNPIELALAIRRLMKDDAYRAALGIAGRRRALDGFTALAAAAQYGRRYTRLAGLHRCRTGSRAAWPVWEAE